MNVPEKRQATVRRSLSWIDKINSRCGDIDCLLSVVAEGSRNGIWLVSQPSKR